MRASTVTCRLILGLLILGSYTPAQDLSPYTVKLFGGYQQQNTEKLASDARGFLVGMQVNRDLVSRLDWNVRLGYDYSTLDEDTVLLEWEWDYWEQYIDWMLMGATQLEIDSMSIYKEYWRTDSSYHGVFNPHQTLGEVMISTGLEFDLPVMKKVSLYGGVNLGANIYKRQIKMVEDWTKNFTFNFDSTKLANDLMDEYAQERFDIFMDLHEDNPNTYPLTYDYNSDSSNVIYRFRYAYDIQITHFSPAKTGSRFFASPFLGCRVALNKTVDLDLGYYGIFYLKNVEKLEDLFRFASQSERWFPYESKSTFVFSLTFNY
ncbi:TPA: hypothetical protein DCG86_09355 [Candidatus Marinimicrobia bacterium]|nr:MAG: hypothetical protein XD77_0709 [Marinimicrobia bacterium 46_47]KUK93353.1 MAG: hypothetical protein XE04_0262 [Marinimicrobia bacterium 46_43]HAE88210.1 hypothetical protein [Candidatus Neomarinimicrobiota bacterium]HBY17849.1 hypothetical protein [Candidatus Neomarinimicrobiota bacterium]